MRLAIMQPYIFPYIGYYQLIHAADKFVIYDDVNFINRGWINRNNLLVNGKAWLFSVPLKEASQNRLIGDIEIADAEWGRKFLKTIEQAYKKSPFYSNVLELISSVVLKPTATISELTRNSLTAVSEYIGLSASFVNSSSIYDNQALKAQERILDICIKEKADHYINPIGGREIYSKELFDNSGIRLNFIKTGNVRYEQFKNEFVPNLSIIDVLMFNDKKDIRQMLDLYELV